MSIVTSTANATVKKIRSLAVRKYRDEEGLFVAEGRDYIDAALRAGWQADTFVYSAAARDTGEQWARAHKARALEVTDKILETVTRRDNAQDIIAVFKQRYHALSSVKDGLWLGLQGIRDPGNLGTIIRTCDAVAAEGVILIGDTCDPFAPETIRATAGSFARMRVARATEDEFAAWRKTFQGRVIGTHLGEHTVDYRKADTTRPLVLLMGSESHGLSPQIAGVCDTLVRIPMAVGPESLNLAVSTGIMLYAVSHP